MDKRTLLARMQGILEANMATLSAPVDDGRRDRAKDVTRFFKNITRNSEGHAVLIWDTKTVSNGHQYKCYIAIEPDGATLFQLAHAANKIKNAIQMLRTADVKCFCTCKDFRYSGAEYNLKHKHDSLEIDHSNRESADINPKVRDPEGKHTLCKHLYSCFNGVMTNAPSIMAKARNAKFPPADKNQQIKQLDSSGETNSNDTGDITTMNGAGSTTSDNVGGQITILNDGLKTQQGHDDTKAIKIMNESAPVQNIPVVTQALDSLASELNSGSTADTGSVDDGSELTVMNGDTMDNIPDTGDVSGQITILNSGESDSGIFDMEDSLESGMFDLPDDDEKS